VRTKAGVSEKDGCVGKNNLLRDNSNDETLKAPPYQSCSTTTKERFLLRGRKHITVESGRGQAGVISEKKITKEEFGERLDQRWGGNTSRS